MSAAAASPTSFASRRKRLAEVSSRHRSWSIVVGIAIVGTVLPILAAIPPFTLATPTNAWMDGFTNAGVFVLLAIGLNLVVGVAGLLDLGYAAFFAIGAYTYSYVASPFGNSILGIKFVEVVSPDIAGLVFWPMLLVGALVAALFGILLGAPTLRLRGDYLAIVTLGFGEIVPIVFLNADAVTNGTNGVGGLARPALPIIGSFSALNPWPYYVSMLVVVAVVMMLAYRLVESRLGRAWEAIREDELAAAASGINTVTAKLLAFALGASTAGIAGVFNASKLVTVSPDQFTFIVSFTVLAMVVLGGMGSFAGALLGGLLIGVVESLGGLLLGESLGQVGIFVIFIAVLLFRPQGLFGARA